MSYGRPLKLRLTSVCYRELLERTLPLLQERLTEHRIELVNDIPPDLPTLEADPELLRTCLINLITNASNAMPEGGKIILGARFDVSESAFRLSFADAGIGIRPEDIPKITQPYFTTREAGIGLGLAITERIVKEHGGVLLIESTLGKGSVFTITLPTRRKEQDI
jgi:signal transduction histidine kinase